MASVLRELFGGGGALSVGRSAVGMAGARRLAGSFAQVWKLRDYNSMVGRLDHPSGFCGGGACYVVADGESLRVFVHELGHAIDDRIGASGSMSSHGSRESVQQMLQCSRSLGWSWHTSGSGHYGREPGEVMAAHYWQECWADNTVALFLHPGWYSKHFPLAKDFYRWAVEGSALEQHLVVS